MSDSAAAVALERVEPDEHCNGRKSDGTLCQQVAGARTQHTGQGRCWLHGGRNLIKHGRYSKIQRERLRDLIEEMAADPDPLDSLDDIAAARALLVDFLDRYDQWRDALLLWYETARLHRRPLAPELVHALGNVVDEWENQLRSSVPEPTERQLADIETARKFIDALRGKGEAPRPSHVLDISEAHRMLGEIARMVAAVHKARSNNAISRPDMNRIMQEMWRSVQLRVSDEKVRNAIQDDWLTVAL